MKQRAEAGTTHLNGGGLWCAGVGGHATSGARSEKVPVMENWLGEAPVPLGGTAGRRISAGR